jgi:(2Fe-2S) ferredoxin
VYAALKRAAAIRGLARQLRINRSGRRSQCGHGSMVVVYPDGVWYAGVQPADADEIADRHLVSGEPVERLCYRPPGPGPNKLPRDADGRPLPPDGD